MPAVNEIWDFITSFAPADLAEEWDNIGPLIKSGNDTDKILVTLDILPAVVREAAQKGCGVIVSHHPVIFSPLRCVQCGQAPYLLIKEGISAICAHTNLDAANGGVNDVLAQQLWLQDVQLFADTGRIGRLDAPMESEMFARWCSEKLNAHVRFTNAQKPIQTVAVVGGSGCGFLGKAAVAGADAFVTGDAGHHDALDALQAGISLVAAGHYETERPVVPALAKKLAEAFPQAQVLCSEAESAPFAHAFSSPGAWQLYGGTEKKKFK